MRLAFGGPLLLEGSNSQHRLRLSLELLDLIVPTRGKLEGSYVLELGSPGWVDALGPQLAQGDVTVLPGSPEHELLLAGLTGSRLYPDPNRNQRVEAEERESGPADTGGNADTEEDSSDSGEHLRQAESGTLDSAPEETEEEESQQGHGNNGNGNGHRKEDSEGEDSDS